VIDDGKRRSQAALNAFGDARWIDRLPPSSSTSANPARSDGIGTNRGKKPGGAVGLFVFCATVEPANFERGGKGLNLRTAAELMGAGASGTDAALLDQTLSGVAIDSRSVAPGELYFALSPDEYRKAGFNGEFADYHQFIPEALERGAIAAVARAARVAGDPALEPLRHRLIFVEDAIQALQRLAHQVYLAWGRKVVAITGSAGKTTAKELTAQLLTAGGQRVLKSERNYNNNLGLPLAVLQMISRGNQPSDFDLAVLEMGMSSPTGEIRRLCEITPPDIGVELRVAPVHLEHLGTIERIAAAKAEMIEGMKPKGIAILNADDDFVLAMGPSHPGPKLTFGIDRRADVMATEIKTGRFGFSNFRLHTPLGRAEVKLPLAGKHNIYNALAAASVAVCFAQGADQIAAALSAVKPADKRGQVVRFAEGFELIDDSYNSNPRSLISMVRSLVDGGAHAKRLLVVAGEMLELGDAASALHFEAGQEIARAGVHELWGVRGFAADINAGARAAGMNESAIKFFDNSVDAAAALVAEVRAGDLILVKGSRGVATDEVVKKLQEHYRVQDEA
jgi:UDP-N-acetylmuramoyl-tripeptide--D-alanyl-D-alanine ligase